MKNTVKQGKLFSRKRVAGIISMVLAIAFLLAGTYAFNDYRQHKTSEADAEGLFYKARLVEVYNPNEAKAWTLDVPVINNQISVLNPGREHANDTKRYGEIYARLQLKEYMEFYPVTYTYSEDRYMLDDEGAYIAFDVQQDADEFAAELDAKYGNGPHEVESLKRYDTVGEKWYIQTKESDPNGIYGDFIITEIEIDTDMPRSLVVGAERASDDQQKAEKHDDHINSCVEVDGSGHNNGECEYTIHTWENGLKGFVPTGSVSGEAFEDYINLVFGENVIMLDQWNGQPVAKWIVDPDSAQGWVYWGESIVEGEQTANLLEEMALINQPDESFYYALHTDMQAVSRNELDKWTDAPAALITSYEKSSIKATGLAIAPNEIAVYQGETQQFSARVTGSVGVSQEVVWQLSSYAGGSTISETGLVTIGTHETAGTLTVTAISVLDGSIHATATVIVKTRPYVTGITITPQTPTVYVGGNVQFSATVLGANVSQSVTWTINSEATALGITINGQGVLSVPYGIPTGFNTVTVTATSVEDSSCKASTAANINHEIIFGLTGTKSDVGKSFSADGYTWKVLTVDDNGNALIVTNSVIGKSMWYSSKTSSGTRPQYPDSLVKIAVDNFFNNTVNALKPYVQPVSSNALATANSVTSVDTSAAGTVAAFILANTEYAAYGSKNIGAEYWTRTTIVTTSNNNPTGELRYISSTGTDATTATNVSRGIRPAMWINVNP